MNKKVFLLILALFSFRSVAANVFLPAISLKGYAHVEGNEIDFYKLHKGYSITSAPRNFFSGIRITTEKEIDFEEKTVKLQVKYNQIELYPPVYISLDSYVQNNFKKLYRDILKANSRELLSTTDRSESAGLIPEIIIELPKIALPKAVRRFMGNKAGRLSLDGNQKLTFAGSSSSRDDPSSEKKKRNNFDLEIRQDLNLRLKGTIGEKIHVNINHQSSSESDVIAVPTEININYEGVEDEVVKRIDGGNISLALTGSRLFSYSTSSEGLFGIKTELEAGNLEITTILGKDEAKKSTQTWRGDSQADSTVIESRNYVKRTHYFIDQPSSLYQLYNESIGVEGVVYPTGWKDNAIVLENGKWTLTPAGAAVLPNPEEKIMVYIDDGNANNNQTTIEGKEIGFEDVYNFDVLIQGSDYVVDDKSGIITLTLPNTISKLYTVGITYTRMDGIIVGDDSSMPVQVKLLKKRNQDFTNDPEYWDLTIRNIYSLGMQNIRNDGFDLNIYSLTASTEPNFNIPSALVPTGIEQTSLTYNDYLRLDTNTDGVINGDDAPIHLDSGHIIFPFIKPFYALEDSVIYEDEEAYYTEFNNYISVKGQIGRDQVSLGRMNILPGSVVIKIGPNKTELTQGIDYLVDYDFGLITFLASEAKNPDVDIFIDYQFKPLFSVESKTIMGIRADMRFNQNLKIGGTFIYQSEKVKEDRPKIGNENRSIILADIDGELEYELPFITKIVDWFPLIKTDSKSTVNISGEVAMSLPRIYGSSKQHDKKEAYIDDMESILDSYPLGVTRATWDPASRPAEFPDGNYIDFGKAAMNFYNPQDIYARDVYDPGSLTEKEERERVIPLACKIKPLQMGIPGMEMKHWAGVMKYIGNEIDFSKKRYIEILARVDTLNYNQTSKPVILHIDLGDVSEDFYRPGENDKPDKEDGLLVNENLQNVDGILDDGEDIGLDRVKNGEPGDDPDDNYDNDEVTINGEVEYPKINGTEGNEKLDTEDLDNSGGLNTADIYFEYSVCLNDGEEFLESEYKGWRLYRIPLHDSENYRTISNEPGKVPNIKKISYARLWFEVEDSTRVKIVSIGVVGNKWEEGFIRDETDKIIVSEEETMLVGIIDNQKDMHYTPAPHTVIEERGEETLEQSLIIDYTNLGSSHYALATQEFREPYNLLTYNKIRFWVYAEALEFVTIGEKPDSLIIRLGADSLNYYEIRHELELMEYYLEMDRDGWHQFEIPYPYITHLKSLSAKDDVSYTKDGYRFSMIGEPNLINIRQISLGMVATEEFSGRLYFDDIRVADPYEDIGFASRATFFTKFADFSDLTINLDWKTENFQSSAARSGSYNTSALVERTQLNISNKYSLHKFFPAEWGWRIPLNLSRNQSLGIPRFQSTSDILREDLSEEDKKREVNRSLTYNANINISQDKTPKSKILAYTIKNTTLYSSIEKKKTLSATSADTTLTWNLRHTYKLTFNKDDVDIGLGSNYKFFFFPQSFNNTFTYTDADPKRWYWETYTDSIPHWVVRSNTTRTRTFDTATNVKYDIFSDISASYNLTTKRDLMLRNYWKKYNIGEEKKRIQDIELKYDPKYLDNIFAFDVDTSVNYNEDHIKIGTQDTLYYKGNVTRNIGGNFTLKNHDLLHSLAVWLDKKLSPEPPSTQELEREDEEREKLEQIRESMLEEQKLNEEELGREQIEEETDLGDGSQEESRDETTLEPIEGQEPETVKKEGDITPGKDEGETKVPKRKKNILASIVGYISRIENIRVSYNNTYKTTYDDRKERPDFLYQLGLPHILDETGDDKEILSKNINDKISTSVGFPILNNLSTNYGYSMEIKRSFGNYSNESVTTTFPNISVVLSEFEKLIKVEKILTSSRLTSSYVYSITEDGDLDFTSPDRENIRINFNPLLSWHGNWVHNITSSLSTNYSDSKTINHYNYSETQTITQSLAAHLEWSFSAAKGLKILFFKRTKLKNELTTQLNFNLEKTLATISGRETFEKTTDKIRYTISPGASYKFSKNIYGGLTSNYEWSDDRKRKQQTSTFSLSIWIEIMF
ncbi:MAG: cell surface protein SprA [Candidatus Cloacimonetes bacterium]|nr:cell surface protein SprA [Candidatus Cloacimonadota bacterium]